ncbi:hypothetical protein FQN57_004024 [Myotisia sp. PD_48]|nr:hypothetical protein FQN57_004024 [Myotisia sp. PD_48]
MSPTCLSRIFARFSRNRYIQKLRTSRPHSTSGRPITPTTTTQIVFPKSIEKTQSDSSVSSEATGQAVHSSAPATARAYTTATTSSTTTLANGADDSISAPHILVVGAAYGGLWAVMNILNLCDGNPQFPAIIPVPEIKLSPNVKPRITILDERDGIFHSMGTPLLHVEHGLIEKAWVRFEEIPALQRDNVIIQQGSLAEIDPLQKRAYWKAYKSQADESNKVINYDYLIAATGLTRDWPIVPKSLTYAGYTQDANSHIAQIKNCTDEYPVVVIGGGAVGTEFAAEIKHHHPTLRVVLIHSRKTLLSNEPLPEEFTEKALNHMRDIGVEVLLETRVLSESHEGEAYYKRVKLSNGEHIMAGHTIWATKRHAPRTSFLPPEALDEEGYVKVLPTMQFCATIPNSTFHFAAGDITSWSGIRRVGRAFSMGQCAGVNVMKAIAIQSSNTSPSVPPPKTVSSNDEEKSNKDDEDKAKTTKMAEFPVVPPMISLALGDTAFMYHPDSGVSGGKELFVSSFGKDLGLTVCWGYLKLPVPEHKEE